MKFFTLAVLITSTFALPRSSEKKSLGQMSLEEGQQKCGEHAKLACCNGRVHSGSDNSNGGILGALLGGNNSGRDGIGQYDQCSEVTSDCMSTLPGFSVIMRTENISPAWSQRPAWRQVQAKYCLLRCLEGENRMSYLSSLVYNC